VLLAYQWPLDIHALHCALLSMCASVGWAVAEVAGASSVYPFTYTRCWIACVEFVREHRLGCGRDWRQCQLGTSCRLECLLLSRAAVHYTGLVTQNLTIALTWQAAAGIDVCH
jgi:hypothetical protein